MSSDPLGTIQTGLGIAQQGKDLVSDYDYPDPRGEILDYGNAPQIQRQQVAGVDTSWMQYGAPAFAHGYAYSPFPYLQFMQGRASV